MAVLLTISSVFRILFLFHRGGNIWWWWVSYSYVSRYLLLALVTMYLHHLVSLYLIWSAQLVHHPILGHIQPNVGASRAPVFYGLIHRGSFRWEYGRIYCWIEPSSWHDRHWAEIRHLHARVRLPGLRGGFYLYEDTSYSTYYALIRRIKGFKWWKKIT